jgi:16S rRNA (cytosine1402-N4)-methyltransferase
LTLASAPSDQHIPVMLGEILVQAAGVAHDLKRPLRIGFDGTFGRGGHTRELLNANLELRMIAFDQDQDAIRFGELNFSDVIKQGRLTLTRANFENMKEAGNLVRETSADGFEFMMLDLGVSSPQLDVAGRGFSFYHDGPLDMRMDDRLQLTAAEIVNEWPEQDLARVFIARGEIEYPFKVVRAILNDRLTTPFSTTKQLAGLIERVDGWAKKGFHPATQYFMALRLEVNRELEVVEKSLPEALKLLAPGGRLAIITFHSLEDRIVKNLFRSAEEGELFGADFGENVKRKAFKPSEKETALNPRSRSAKLRVFRRFAVGETKGPKNKYAHLAKTRHGEPPEPPDDDE